MTDIVTHDYQKEKIDLDTLTPKEIVKELDNYIIGQGKAKRSVAIAMRNRMRRRKVSDEIREEIYPKNIIMIGPTGCGKTEIARRISKLTGAPFIKVEATKYTEVGYVGRDVESMVRDLAGISISMVQKEYRMSNEAQAQTTVEERLLDLLLPGDEKKEAPDSEFLKSFSGFGMSSVGRDVSTGMQEEQSSQEAVSSGEEEERKKRVREMFRDKLRSGEMEDKEVEIDVHGSVSPMIQVLSGHNMEDIDMQVQNMLGDFMPKKTKRRRLSIADARKVLLEEELDRMLDQEKIQAEAIRRVEEMGIIFIDEMDKVCGRGGGSHGGSGADVSREGVQRDLLPIVEGATVNTRNGPVKTDHILFIAAGAFHNAKPSDLIPELQGRFPIRVELEKLSEEDFRKILTGPQNSLTKQSQALLGTEGVSLKFTEEGIASLAGYAFRVNEETENIGARRLHTIMEHLLDEISFDAPELSGDEKNIVIDKEFVDRRLQNIVENRDLSQYIL